MKTHLDCLPCLYKQALFTARLCSQDQLIHKRVLMEIGELFKELDFTLSPPENAVAVYQTITDICGIRDPFSALKSKSNETAMAMRPQIIKLIEQHADPLYAAIKYAIAGNIIDYGSHQEFDIDETLKRCLTEEPVIDDFLIFQDDLKRAKTILYLADNCGEIIFDGILIEKINKDTYLAVKDGPIINDATKESAASCGLDGICTILSNGTCCPGTPIDSCSDAFRELFSSADLVISKGQGNFETLSESSRPIYFLFQVKCAIVAQHVEELRGKHDSIEVGSMIFWKREGHGSVRRR